MRDAPRAARACALLATWIRQLAGMPDYHAYLHHLAAHHPGQAPMSEAEYFTDYLERRYANGPNRCC